MRSGPEAGPCQRGTGGGETRESRPPLPEPQVHAAKLLPGEGGTASAHPAATYRAIFKRSLLQTSGGAQALLSGGSKSPAQREEEGDSPCRELLQSGVALWGN